MVSVIENSVEWCLTDVVGAIDVHWYSKRGENCGLQHRVHGLDNDTCELMNGRKEEYAAKLRTIVQGSTGSSWFGVHEALDLEIGKLWWLEDLGYRKIVVKGRFCGDIALWGWERCQGAQVDPIKNAESPWQWTPSQGAEREDGPH